MDDKITKEWGYKVESETSLNFYHILLPIIGISFLSRNLKTYKEITLKEDGNVLITVEYPLDLLLVKSELEFVLENMVARYAVTDNFVYRAGERGREFLKNWFLAVEGAIALITIAQAPQLRLKPYDFELINSGVGGIYLHPFTRLSLAIYPDKHLG